MIAYLHIQEHAQYADALGSIRSGEPLYAECHAPYIPLRCMWGPHALERFAREIILVGRAVGDGKLLAKSLSKKTICQILDKKIKNPKEE